MRIVVGSDHGGFGLKEAVVEHLAASGHDVQDVGTATAESVDYPDFGAAVGSVVAKGDADFGVALCGSGLGICIAANKVAGVRAVTITDMTSARLSRQHNNANVVCMGERLIGTQTALDALDTFVSTEFEGGRHARRVDKISALESDE